MKDYSIAPFEIEQRDEPGEYEAKWEDVCEEARRHLIERGKELPPGGFDIRMASYWFEELHVAWDEDTIYPYQEHSSAPWMLIWRAW